MTPPKPDLIADRFEAGDLIGDGGLSYVFSGWDRRRKQNVAIKWLKRDLIGSDQQLAKQLWQEASTLGAVHHPNIVSIIDFGINAEGAYIITELLEGETLEHVLARGPFSMPHFMLFARGALAGLYAAHRIHVVHRDINPTNFFLQLAPPAAFCVKILDFGQAKYSRKPMPQTVDNENALLGSIHYVSPEQFERQPVDHRSDLYSLGCILFEALTGKEAFAGKNVTEIMQSHLSNRLSPILELRPDTPPRLEKWILKLVSRNPHDRYQTAAQALDILAQIEKSLPAQGL